MTVADARELFANNAWANRKFFAARNAQVIDQRELGEPAGRT